MKKNLATDEVIEHLVAALGEDVGARQRHLYRENLRNLVRMAKSEQLLDIKNSVRRVAETVELHSARQRTKAILSAQRLPDIVDRLQKQFEFKH